MDTEMTKLDAFSEMERADEEAVLSEIKGKAIETLVYEVRGATGLSLPGVREVARTMNKNGAARIGISDKEPTIIETEDYFEVRVYATDTLNGGGNWGVKRQPKFYKPNEPNLFALEQALSKAQRNAVRGLIPEWFVKQMIDAWRQDKSKVKTIDQPRQPTNPGIGKDAKGNVTQPKPVPTRPTRPYTPEQLKQVITDEAAKRDAQNPTVTDGTRGITVNYLQGLFDDDKENQTRKRHELTAYLLGKASSKDWTAGETTTLSQWASNSQHADWVKIEAERVLVEHLKEQGQKELSLEKQPETTAV